MDEFGSDDWLFPGEIDAPGPTLPGDDWLGFDDGPRIPKLDNVELSPDELFPDEPGSSEYSPLWFESDESYIPPARYEKAGFFPRMERVLEGLAVTAVGLVIIGVGWGIFGRGGASVEAAPQSQTELIIDDSESTSTTIEEYEMIGPPLPVVIKVDSLDFDEIRQIIPGPGTTTTTATPSVTTTTVNSETVGSDVCVVGDLEIPRQLLAERIAVGAEVKRAMSREEFEGLSKAINMAETREEINNLATEALFKLGVVAKFVDVDAIGDEYFTGEPSEISTQEEYQAEMLSQLYELQQLPADFVGLVSTIRFVDASKFSAINPETGEEAYYAGFASAWYGRISLSQRNPNGQSGTLTHELAHLAHEQACSRYSDAELESFYDEIYSLAVATGMYDTFPSEYSRTSYEELMADLTEDLLISKGFLDAYGDPIEMLDENAILLQEMVIERLQEAVPTVDWVAYLQYLDSTSSHPLDLINASEVERANLSPLDLAYVRNYEKDDVELVPAVIIMDSQGRTQTIYASIEELGNENSKADQNKLFSIAITVDPNHPSYDEIVRSIENWMEKVGPNSLTTTDIFDWSVETNDSYEPVATIYSAVSPKKGETGSGQLVTIVYPPSYISIDDYLRK